MCCGLKCCSLKCVGILVAILAFIIAMRGPFNYLVRRTFSIAVIEGVHLPYDYSQKRAMLNILDLNFATNIDVVGGGVTRASRLPSSVVNKSKDSTDAIFESVQANIVKKDIKECPGEPDPMPGYLYFGNKKFAKILGLFFKENPFFALFLTAGEKDGESYLQLQAYDEDSGTADLGTYYSKFANLIVGNTRLINVRFNADMEITYMSYYDKSAKKKVVVPPKDFDYWASAVLYETHLFAGSIHATIHVLHYILTTGIDHATQHDLSLKTWSFPYSSNIPVKYIEVGGVLLRPHLSFVLDKLLSAALPETHWLATGSNALTADVGDVLKDIYKLWGSVQTAQDFVDKFLFKDLYNSKGGKKLAKKADILKEYQKIAKHIGPFAKDLTDVMQENDPAAFRSAEKTFKNFIEGTGDSGMTIFSISSFIEIMSATGIVHGSTLSYTRLAVQPEIMRWKNDYKAEWEEEDVTMINLQIGTITGMEVGRHVFMGENPDDSISRDWQTDNMDPKLQKVMRRYDEKINKIKEDNKAKLLENPDRMREYGWILTDWCPDGFDGKQMTLATYI